VVAWKCRYFDIFELMLFKIGVFFFLAAQFCYGQINLVPNPSFVNFVTFADNLPASSTDYFNACAIDSLVDVPTNYFGYQYAHSGDGYAGFASGYFNGSNLREYVEVKLVDTLKANYKYSVNFYLSCADNSRKACNSFSALLSFDSVVYSSPQYYCLCSENPQINYSGAIISDSSGWTLITDTIIAAGGEQFLTIGTFPYDSLINWITFNPNGIYYSAYYYIDDVSVVLIDSSVGIVENKYNRKLKLYPNPCSNILNIETSCSNLNSSEIFIYNLFGELMMTNVYRKGVDISSLNAGCYYLQLNTESEIIVSKFIKAD
jgi:hypothetical protein